MNLDSGKSLRSTITRRFVSRAALTFVSFLLVGAGQVCLSQTEIEDKKLVLDGLEIYYYTQDPHYTAVAAQLPNVKSALDNLRARVAAAQTGRPDQTPFTNCLRAIDTALRRVKGALLLNGELVGQYGDVAALLSPSAERDENRLAKVMGCLADLKMKLGNDPAIADAATALDRLRQNMEDEFEQIDEGKAKRKARAALRRVVPKKEKKPKRAAPPQALRKEEGRTERIGAGPAVMEEADVNPPGPTVGPCDNINFEKENYEIRSVRIDDPFDFLPWVKKREKNAYDRIAKLVLKDKDEDKDKPFRYVDVSGKALDIIEEENFLPNTTDKRVKLRLEIVSVENCAGGKLDLVYRVYSTEIMPVLSAAPESRVTERELPQVAAGQTTVAIPASQPAAAGQTTVVAPAPKPVHFTPLGGYDSTNVLSGGGHLEITPRSFWKLPFKSFIVEGQGSSRMHYISAALAGSVDSSADSTDASSLLAHAEWLLSFTNYSLPTGFGQIKGGHLSAQFSGTTKPLGGGNFTFRFGGLLEGGNGQSDIRGVALAPDTVASDGFGTLKLYAGLDSRLGHNVLSASYGLELGSIGPSTRVDWRKHIADARHEFWYSIGDHRILDLESRFTLGSIQVPGKIPLPEKFFGGNNEELFITGDTWQIRTNPVIRAIPGSRFFRTADGAGSKRFFSYNLTAAYAVWRKTLVPQELTTDPDFNSELQGAITTVTSTLQNYYASKDPHYASVVTKLPQAQTDLDNLKATVAASLASHPGQVPDLYKACTKAVSGALRRINSAITPEAADQYSLITFLLSDDPDEIQLVKVIQACGTDLNATIHDSSIATASNQLNNDRQAMVAEFSQINQDEAANKARADMAFTRRTLHTLFNDVNIYSASPVFVFDVAKISPSKGGLGGVRYGPGFGLRLELASVAHFTAGYAWNVRRGPGEGRGNVFFSIGIRDLFR